MSRHIQFVIQGSISNFLDAIRDAEKVIEALSTQLKASSFDDASFMFRTSNEFVEHTLKHGGCMPKMGYDPCPGVFYEGGHAKEMKKGRRRPEHAAYWQWLYGKKGRDER